MYLIIHNLKQSPKFSALVFGIASAVLIGILIGQTNFAHGKMASRPCLWEVDATTACHEQIRFFKFRNKNSSAWKQAIKIGLLDGTLAWVSGLEPKTGFFSVRPHNPHADLNEVVNVLEGYGVKGTLYRIETKDPAGKPITYLEAIVKIEEPYTMLELARAHLYNVSFDPTLKEAFPSLYEHETILKSADIAGDQGETDPEQVPLNVRLSHLETGKGSNVKDSLFAKLSSSSKQILNTQLYNGVFHRRFAGVFAIGDSLTENQTSVEDIEQLLGKYFDKFTVDPEAATVQIESAAGLWIYHALYSGWIKPYSDQPKVTPVGDYAENVRNKAYSDFLMKQMAWFDN